MELLSIPKEATACRAAFAGVPVGAMAWHCHHEVLAERLTEPADARIAFILSNKPKAERALRLRLFRPALAVAVKTASAARDAQRRPAHDAYLVAEARAAAAYTFARNADAAYDDARPAYDAAMVTARDAYYAAIKPADAANAIALGPTHAAECMDCPWDGKTIFPEAV